jgi:uncharacterized protein
MKHSLPKYLLRQSYVDQIRPFVNKQIIKVLTGQRRVGKSYIMFQLMDMIADDFPDGNIIYINMELEDFAALRDHASMCRHIKDQLLPGKRNFLFIDEIQEVEGFQFCIRDLLATAACDIFITGSNAQILSGELASYLSGRYIAFNIHSLSYEEFLQFHQLQQGTDSLQKYLQYGGMPYLVNIGLQDDLPFEYLKNVYASILLKDVVARENIRNVSFLESLTHYLADNTGNLFSALNISKYLKSQQVNISPQMVINYLSALCNAFVIHRARRAEVGGLKIFESGEKYYFEDLGLRNSITGFKQRTDLHKLLENAVYLKLLQAGYRVLVGKMGHKEIDFMAEKNGQTIYVQACLTLSSENTEMREFGNLLMIEDNHPKYVVTLNDLIIGSNYKGILHLNLEAFLLSEI